MTFAVRLAAAAALLCASAALAQGYPNKPVRIFVGYAPGGSADAGVRPLAKALEPVIGQPLVTREKLGQALAIGKGSECRLAEVAVDEQH